MDVTILDTFKKKYRMVVTGISLFILLVYCLRLKENNISVVNDVFTKK